MKIRIIKFVVVLAIMLASSKSWAATFNMDFLNTAPGYYAEGIELTRGITISPVYVDSQDPFTGDALNHIALFGDGPLVLGFDKTKVLVSAVRVNGFSNNVYVPIFGYGSTGNFTYYTSPNWDEGVVEVKGIGDISKVIVNGYESGVTSISIDYQTVSPDDSSWKAGCHEVYTGDYNNDGVPDFYLKSIPENKTLTIPYGINIDVTTTCGVADVVLQVSTNGEVETIYPPEVTLLENTVWTLDVEHQLVYDDYDNDNVQDVLVQAQTVGSVSYSLLAVKDNEPPFVNESVIRTEPGPEGEFTPGVRPSLGAINGNSYSKSGAAYVGKLDGQFSVTSNGKPNYLIPIVSTPSVQNIAPQFSLSYNGGSGNDIMGIGWHLEGLSKIERCGTTIVQDGYINTTNFNSSDKFCLNGQRLVVVSGTYGAAGAEYRTENESFTKIISNGNQGKGPQSFTVWHADGAIEAYGGTANSRQLTQSSDTVVQWGISAVQDRENNAATYKYVNNRIDGEFYINRVEFNGNSTRFVYESRQDITPSYANDLKSQLSVRLDKVETYQGASRVRRYDLNYEVGNATKRSRLINVKECLSDGCKPATIFDWDLGNEEAIFSQTTPPQTSTYPSPGTYEDQKYHLADVNADGRSDLIWTYRVGDSLGRGLYTANADGSFTEQSIDTDTGFNASLIPTGQQQYLTGDVNGDGRSDLVYVARNLTDVYRIVYLANDTGTGFISQGYEVDVFDKYQFYTDGKFHLADINGDKRQDLVWTFTFENKFAQTVYLAKNDTLGRTSLEKVSFNFDTTYSPDFYDNNNFTLGDVNGDGKSDLVWTYFYQNNPVRTLYLANANGTAFDIISLQIDDEFFQVGGDFYGEVISLYKNHNFNLGDVNADGKADLVWTFNLNNEFRRVVYLASAKGTSHTINTVTSETIPNLNPDNHKSSSIQMADLNGDGRQDLIYTYNDVSNTVYEAYAFISDIDGQSFLPGAVSLSTNPSSTIAHENQHHLFGDVNADGKTDLVWAYNTNTTLHRKTYTLPASHPDHITKITDGFGLETNIRYRYLADNSTGFYVKDSDAVYPVRDDAGLSYLVDHIEVSDGIGGIHQYDYKYIGAKTALDGRGFLGFRQRIVTDQQTGFISTETYHQAFPFIGLKQSVVVEQANGTPVEKVFNHWAQHTIPHIGGRDTTYRYLKDTVAIKYDLNGASVLADVTIDQYNLSNGTLENRVTATGRGFSGSIDASYTVDGQFTANQITGRDRTITTAYSYNNNVANWRIGFVSNKSMTYAVPGTASKTVVTAFTPHSTDSFLLKTEKQFPGTANEITNTYSRYADGNVRYIHVSGQDIDSQTFIRNTLWGDYVNGMYPESRWNFIGHTTYFSYNQRVGKVTRSTDPNGLITDSVYDDFGRLALQRAADGTDTTIELGLCGITCPTHAKYKSTTTVTHQHQANQQGAPQVTKYFDALHRELRTEKVGFDGRIIRTDTRYDSRGRVEFVSKPHYVGDAAQWTEYKYDLLSRVTHEYPPNGGTIVTDYSTDSTYATRTTVTQTIVLPEGGTKTVTSTRKDNSIDQLKESVDADNTPTRYSYDALGNLSSVVVNNDVATTVTMQYDLAGNKTHMLDPDAGEITYEYNAAGELRRQIQDPSGLGHRVVTGYDYIGRVKSREEFDGTTTVNYIWEYDTAINGIGFLALTSGPDYESTLEYDAFARIHRSTTSLFNETEPKVFRFGYDGFSRKRSTEYPSGISINTGYNSTGYTKRISNKVTNEIYRDVQAVDALGNVIQETYGNGKQTVRQYDPALGKLTSLQTGTGTTSTETQNASFSYDSSGNLYQRSNNAISESFTYDNLSRVKTASTQGLTSGARLINYDYDALGNIVTKSDVSDNNGYFYAENGAGVHAVSRVVKDGSTINYGYDVKGNMTSRNNATINYAVFNKPLSITKPGSQTNFRYNPDREQYYRLSNANGTVTEHFYYGAGTFEVVKQGEQIREKTYVGDFLVHNKVRQVGSLAGGSDVRYLHRDHIGSVEAITDENGTILTRMAFDPYGSRRKADWENADAAFNSALPATTFNTTDRGFTNHEHIDAFGLIQTSGRLYDPVIGRFVSPDDFVQYFESSQSYNRYSYVLNNPLSHTDESGEVVIVGTIIAVAVIANRVYAIYDTATNGVEEAKTALDENKSTAERVDAGISLASRFVGGSAGNKAYGVTKNLGKEAIKHTVKAAAKAKDVLTATAKAAKTKVGALTDKARGWYTKKKSSGKSSKNSKPNDSEGTKDKNTENNQVSNEKKYHGNDRRNPNPQHNYDILDKDKRVRKTGVGTGEAKDDVSKRAESQLEEGDTYVIRDRIPGQPGARGKAYDREKELAKEHYANGEPMDKHKRPK